MKGLNLAVIGAGALGSEICRILAENAFLNVLIIDPDRLEPHNVPLSSLYTDAFSTYDSEAFTHFKAELLVDVIQTQYALTWNGIVAEVADVGLGRLATCDLIISCTDSSLARIETSIAARILGLPMLDGGVMGEGIAAGRVSWFSPAREAACYLCGISDIRRAELLSYAISTSLGCRLFEETANMTGTSDALRETAVTMFRFIEAFSAGGRSFENSFSTRLDGSRAVEPWIHENLKLSRSVSCPWHDVPEGEWLPLAYDRPIRDSLSGNDLRLELVWPQCMEARCHRCGHCTSPKRRVALIRRKTVCTRCGAVGSCEPTKIVSSLGIEDAGSGFTPRQLGLPEQHLYLFRRTFDPVITRKEVDEPVA